jgi:hypothetical protein
VQDKDIRIAYIKAAKRITSLPGGIGQESGFDGIAGGIPFDREVELRVSDKLVGARKPMSLTEVNLSQRLVELCEQPTSLHLLAPIVHLSWLAREECEEAPCLVTQPNWFVDEFRNRPRRPQGSHLAQHF